MIPFENTYSKLPERFYERIHPEAFSNPELIIFNKSLADELNIDYQNQSQFDLAQVFSGQKILEGSEPMAQAYAGFQFGHPSPVLGDGRSALGPVLREYIVSEAMNVLGVPTTRALAAVATNEPVYRQFGAEPGGIFTRVADSHLRVGTFQYFAFQQDWEGMEILLDYALKRHYPALAKLKSQSDQCLQFLKVVMNRQAELVAKWSSLGFIHGVMNTDNFSIAGITIDYGPCAFMDEFGFDKKFSFVDQQGRYSFFNQVPIAQWNLFTLADCLLPFIHSDKDKAVELIRSAIAPEMEKFAITRWSALAEKIGIDDYQNEDEELIHSFLRYLEREELDFTKSFRELPNLFHGQTDYFSKTKELDLFVDKWKARVSSVDKLNQINPLYIPRNHLIERAIQEAYDKDFDFFHQLIEVTSSPFKENKDLKLFSTPPRPEERVKQTFCGT